MINYPSNPTDQQQFSAAGMSWAWSAAKGAWLLIPVSTADAVSAAQAALAAGTSATNAATSATNAAASAAAANASAITAGTSAGNASTSATSALNYRNQTQAIVDAAAAAGVNSINGRTGVVTLTKADAQLPNVDNTSDANKPVSTAQATAIAAKEPALVAGTTAQYYRGDKSWQTLNPTAVGLANVNNTSDANKPVSTAQATAIALKEPAVTAGTTGQFYRGDKSWATLDKTAVGLPNVDNTADAAKPISTATATALAGKEPAISAPGAGYYYRGDKTWATLNPAAAGLANVYNVAQTYNLRPGGAAVYIGYTGSVLDLQVNSTYFGGTWPISITGGATSLNGIGGWRYQNVAANTQYVWATNGNSGDNFLTQPGNLSVAYAAAANSSNLLQGQAGGYWINNGSTAAVNLRNNGAAYLVVGISGYGDVTWSVIGSDERLKENIAPTTQDSLAKIRQIDFKQFNYRLLESGFQIDDGRLHKLGPIAQQLQVIDDEWVHEDSTWLQPNQYPMLMAAMHAIKQQANIIDALTTRITALESK